MIVVLVVVGIAVALSVAGWVPVVRDALRVDHVLPGPTALAEAVDAAVRDAVREEPDVLPEAVSA